MQIKLSLHHLGEVAYELNLSAPFKSLHYYSKTIPVQSTLGALIQGLLTSCYLWELTLLF